MLCPHPWIFAGILFLKMNYFLLLQYVVVRIRGPLNEQFYKFIVDLLQECIALDFFKNERNGDVKLRMEQILFGIYAQKGR